MPALFQNDLDNTSRQIKRLTQVDLDGTVRTLSQLWQNDLTGTPRLIYSAFGGTSGVSVAPTAVYGRVNSKATIRVTTGTATGTVNSGTAPFTYAWEFDEGDWSALQPALASTAFRSPPLAPGSDASAGATLVVTDANGMIARSNQIQLSATNDGFL